MEASAGLRPVGTLVPWDLNAQILRALRDVRSAATGIRPCRSCMAENLVVLAREGGALAKMLINPGSGSAGVEGEVKKFFAHAFGENPEQPMEGWQQFVVHAVDERGDGITDYMIQVLTQRPDGTWSEFQDMYTDVHAYGPDPSFRCFHVRLPPGICAGKIPLRLRINASTGTELMAYQGYGSEVRHLSAVAEPVELDINDLGEGNGSLFFPFTTTLIEIVLNREPLPFDKPGRILQWLTQ